MKDEKRKEGRKKRKKKEGRNELGRKKKRLLAFSFDEQ
jgi:hypothetical protein